MFFSFSLLVGHSTDRRTLAHIGEVFREDNIKCLMCFICGCKHMYHHGFDKFGRSRSKGETDYRTDSSQHLRRVLVGTAEENSAWSYNSSRKRFDDHFGDAIKTFWFKGTPFCFCGAFTGGAVPLQEEHDAFTGGAIPIQEELCLYRRSTQLW